MEAARNNTGNDLTVEGDEAIDDEEREMIRETSSQHQLGTTPNCGEDLMANLLHHQFSTNSFGQGTSNLGLVEQLVTYATHGNQRVSEQFLNINDELNSQTAEAINIGDVKKQLRGPQDPQSAPRGMHQTDTSVAATAQQNFLTSLRNSHREYESMQAKMDPSDQHQSVKRDEMNLTRHGVMRQCQSNTSVMNIQNNPPLSSQII